MRLIKLAPEGVSYDFIGWRNAAMIASGAALAISILATLFIGLNFGIDFKGGSQVQARFSQEADLAKVREIVGNLDLGDTAVQGYGAPTDVMIRVEAQDDAEEDLTGGGDSVTERITAALKEAFPDVDIREAVGVGPKVSGELVQAGIYAVISAVALVLAYIWIRFEWQFSVGAVGALAHDVILTLGVFSILQIDFTLAIIAAILTIVGYSLNDTVVVFDRIRENLRRYKSAEIPAVLNRSINETLSRTVMTSVTTLIALLSLYILGGEVLRGFTFAMIWGVLIGTYSSIFIAAPILLMLGVTRTDLERADKTVDRGDQPSMALNDDGTPL